MVDVIRYGAGGVPMVNQQTKKVEPVEKTKKTKKKQEDFKKSLKSILMRMTDLMKM